MSDYTKELKGQEKETYIKEHFKTETLAETETAFSQNHIDYQKQGSDFLTDTKTTMTVDYAGYDFYFDDDKDKRDIYRITLKRNGKTFSFRFGQSIAESRNPNDPNQRTKIRKVPTAYDILACLTKYDPYTFENFCYDYGYDIDSRKAEKTYHAVKEEFHKIESLFSDVIEKLQEIQ